MIYQYFHNNGGWYSSKLIYFVGEGDDKTVLITGYDEEEALRYPIHYEMNVASRISINNITDGDNVIDASNSYVSTDWNGTEYVDTIYVYGTNETLGTDLVIENVYEDVTFTYELVDDSDTYVGKLTATYKSQTKTYFVKYVQN